MTSRHERLLLALAAFGHYRTPGRTRAALRTTGLTGLRNQPEMADELSLAHHVEVADRLSGADVDVVALGDDRYPVALGQMKSAPPILFTWGNTALFSAPGVGMCGSRHASERGLEAARICGLEVADHGLAVISGYAKGVDTETHLAALSSGGRTVIVLAEGINGFRRKRAFNNVDFDQEHVLVVSQFAPAQRWNVGAAMTRNGIITGLGRALVVVEAGETGGTLNAGLQALDMGRPVLALDFSTQETPSGNQKLFERGALPIRGRQHLGRVLDAVRTTPGHSRLDAEQLDLLA